MEVLTPQLIWKGYDASVLPLATTVLSDEKTENARVITAYFNGSTTPDGIVRVFARCILPNSRKKLPAVIYMGDAYKSVMEIDPSFYTERGYAVILPDYAGHRDDDYRHTLYPIPMSYANFTPDCLTTAPKDIRLNCWVIWAQIAMRAITFAASFDEIDSEHVALVGESISQTTVIKAAAVDSRISCAVTKFSVGNTGKKISDRLRLVSLLDSSYASMIKVPMLTLLASNEQDGSVDRLSDVYSLISKESGSRLSISEHANHVIGFKQQNNEELWLKYYLKNEGDIPEQPTIIAEEKDRNFCYKITAPTGEAELFVSQGVTNGAIRYWKKTPLKKIRKGEYTAKVNIFDVRQPVYAFVNVKAGGGMSVSSPILAKVPALLGVKQIPAVYKHIIYSTEMGTDGWIANSPLAHTGSVSIIKGPFGIEGISSDVGTLSTFRFSDAGSYGKSSSLLQFLLYSTKEQDVKFTVLTFKEENGEKQYAEYSFTSFVNPADNWKKFTLQASEFKSPYSFCSGWSEVAELRIDSDYPVALASVIWV